MTKCKQIPAGYHGVFRLFFLKHLSQFQKDSKCINVKYNITYGPETFCSWLFCYFEPGGGVCVCGVWLSGKHFSFFIKNKIKLLWLFFSFLSQKSIVEVKWVLVFVKKEYHYFRSLPYLSSSFLILYRRTPSILFYLMRYRT